MLLVCRVKCDIALPALSKFCLVQADAAPRAGLLQAYHLECCSATDFVQVSLQQGQAASWVEFCRHTLLDAVASQILSSFVWRRPWQHQEQRCFSYGRLYAEVPASRLNVLEFYPLVRRNATCQDQKMPPMLSGCVWRRPWRHQEQRCFSCRQLPRPLSCSCISSRPLSAKLASWKPRYSLTQTCPCLF